jgi:ribonuclease HI
MTSTRNIEKLEEFFWPMDCEVIRSIPLRTSGAPDFWGWHFETTGIFSVRSCYRAIVATKSAREDWFEERAATSNPMREEKAWAKLWKVPVPSKIRVFLWRVARHSLPTGDVRHDRHMAPSPACSICGLEDSWRHSLFECNMSRCVWSLMGEEITDLLAVEAEPVARLWLFHVLESWKEPHRSRMLVTMWAIWHARRKAIHEEVYQSPMATVSFVNRFLDDLVACEGVLNKEPSSSVAGRMSSTGAPRWIAPPDGVTKINVDAAVSKGTARGAVGVVCRSQNGDVLGVSAMVFEGLTEPGILEALACREALDAAEDLYLAEILVASDCANVIKGLQGVNLGVYGSILAEIRERARIRGNVRFVFERRESNGDAHRLARYATSLDGGRYTWYTDPPEGVILPVIPPI